MVYALGEILLDVVTDKEIPRKDFLAYGHAGGAMLNAAVSLARSGVNTALVSEIGDDDTGRFLLAFLHKDNIDTQFIRQYHNHLTSVALARLDAQKKPTYTFQKRYPLQRKLIIPKVFYPSDILIFGSLYALDPAIRTEISKITQKAVRAGSLILYDPNIRLAQQLSDKERKKALFENLALATIIKGSDEDFNAIFGQGTPQDHISSLQEINPEAVIFFTMGDRGALAVWKNQIITKPARKIEAVSTIGAGDGFNAGIAAYIVQNKLSEKELPRHLKSLLDTGITFSTAVCRSKYNYIPQNNL